MEGSRQCMREDLYKKHVSADPVAARLPYAIVTRLVELIGWKRLELNKVVRFHGVTEQSLNSILRRSWVCVIKSRFVNQDQLNSISNATDHGIFLKKPELKNFVKQHSTKASMWSIIQGFMSENSRKSCIDMIEEYATGGDGGVTQEVVRLATDLPLKRSKKMKIPFQRSSTSQSHMKQTLLKQVCYWLLQLWMN